MTAQLIKNNRILGNIDLSVITILEILELFSLGYSIDNIIEPVNITDSNIIN